MERLDEPDGPLTIILRSLNSWAETCDLNCSSLSSSRLIPYVSTVRVRIWASHSLFPPFVVVMPGDDVQHYKGDEYG